jgi:hypothetical protein
MRSLVTLRGSLHIQPLWTHFLPPYFFIHKPVIFLVTLSATHSLVKVIDRYDDIPSCVAKSIEDHLRDCSSISKSRQGLTLCPGIHGLPKQSGTSSSVRPVPLLMQARGDCRCKSPSSPPKPQRRRGARWQILPHPGAPTAPSNAPKQGRRTHPVSAVNASLTRGTRICDRRCAPWAGVPTPESATRSAPSAIADRYCVGSAARYDAIS